jgi:hypothetical protein
LWTVPAVVMGHWRIDLDLGDGKPQLIVLSFNQKYQMVSAAGESRSGLLKIDQPTLKGDEIDFFIAIGTVQYRFTGKVQGDKIEGRAISMANAKPVPWRANKLPPVK